MKTNSIFLFLTILTGLIALHHAGAQTTATRSLTLDVGPSHLQRQDIIFSPFIHTAFSGINGGLQFEREKNMITRYALRYAGFSAGIETPYTYTYEGDIKTAYPHGFTFVSLSYAAGCHLGKKDNHRPVLGGAVQLDVQALDYQYGRYSFFGYYSTTSANAWYQHILPVGQKGEITGLVQLPVVSWMARSPYLINDDAFIENTYSHNGFTTFFEYLADGELVTWDKLQRADLSVQYTLNATARWQFGLRYAASFLHVNTPRPLTSIQQDLHLTITHSL